MAILELPECSAQQKSVSDQFLRDICAHIEHHGAIPFSEYMHHSLYAEGLGYYVNGFSKLGKHGDFTTAPEISDDFAFCLAQQCLQVISTLDRADILEFGGGSGRLARDLLQNLHKLDALPERYLILEVSSELQQAQRELLQLQLPAEVFGKVHWLQNLPDSFSGIVIANEVFDAFAVERFTMIDGNAHRLMVDCSDDGLVLQPVVSDFVNREVAAIQQETSTFLEDGYTSEFCALLGPWWQALSECFDKGAAIICDYGMERNQYYSPTKSSGTLRCFFRHTLHDDPFARPAVQDITADVDFTAVAIAATSAGFELQGYSPLSEFMLSLGVLEHHQKKIESLDTREQLIATGDLKRIILPQEMGDRFRVIGFSRAMDGVLDGFSRADWSRLL